MSEAISRTHLRRQLEAHLIELGYSSVRPRAVGRLTPEIVRVSPVRGRLVYGETVLGGDLERPGCHERLRLFSQRRTRRRASILFFIGVPAAECARLEALLQKLDIRSGTRGGHVHVVPIPPPLANERRVASRAQRG
jgi:hypothetical protein